MLDPLMQPTIDWVLKSFGALGESIVLADARRSGYPLIFVSHRFSDVTGYAVSECLGRKCSFLQGPESAPESISRIRSALRDARPHTEEILNYRKDGSPFWNRLFVSPLEDSSGSPLYYIGVQHDVTELKRLERNIAWNTQAGLTGTGPDGLPINELSLSIAHEINTPITVADGRIQMAILSLQSEPANVPEALKALREASTGLHRLAKLVASLRAFAHHETTDFLQPTPLGGIVSDAVSIARRACEGVTFDFRSEALLFVVCDKTLVVQALVNLIMKAADAARSTREPLPVVTLLVEEAPFNGASIFVSDNGPLASDDLNSRLLDPFFSTKQDRGNIGLRLSLCRAVFERHGGTLAFESAEGAEGFRCVLPRYLAADESAHANPKS